MANRAPRICSHTGCNRLTKERYCSEHTKLHGWNEHHNGKTADERGYGSAWRKQRTLKLSINPLCEYCKEQGRVTAATEVDHRLPKALGGTDDIENLASTCNACHKAKTAREWMKKR